MKTENTIATLKRIKKAIYTSDAVICVVWMPDASNETVVEAIDGLLIDLGVDANELEKENEVLQRVPRE